MSGLLPSPTPSFSDLRRGSLAGSAFPRAGHFLFESFA